MYAQLAREVEESIACGILAPGDRLPSVRALSRSRGVSISTVLEAYARLEESGQVEARAKSGFFVAQHPLLRKAGDFATLHPQQAVATVVSKALMAGGAREVMDFSVSSLKGRLCPTDAMQKALRKVVRQEEPVNRYSELRGDLGLRIQIAKRLSTDGCRTSAEQLVITSGAIEALHLALRVVAAPGDAVAVETPTYFALLPMLMRLELRPVEVSTDPAGGMDLQDLDKALRSGVRAVVTVAHGNNPLGFMMPDAKGRDMVEMCARAAVPIIEDDAFGDLAFSVSRPAYLKSYDRQGNVLLLSSFSKSISPGLGIGWLEPGRFAEAVLVNRVTRGVVPALTQSVVAELLRGGAYQRHLKFLRSRLPEQIERYRTAILKSFPRHTRVSKPAGGYLLWVELPEGRPTSQLFDLALQEGIAILPGRIFSAHERYENCLRISCGIPWSESVEKSLRRLGSLAGSL